MDASLANALPEWIGTALLGAVIAGLGYVATLPPQASDELGIP